MCLNISPYDHYCNGFFLLSLFKISAGAFLLQNKMCVLSHMSISAQQRTPPNLRQHCNVCAISPARLTAKQEREEEHFLFCRKKKAKKKIPRKTTNRAPPRPHLIMTSPPLHSTPHYSTRSCLQNHQEQRSWLSRLLRNLRYV